jgi:hypothetical protein
VLQALSASNAAGAASVKSFFETDMERVLSAGMRIIENIQQLGRSAKSLNGC